jgi:peptidyl-prolyl cis-trans isomerase D
MIQSLRYYSESWLFKAFLALIVFCFVFIGAGDLIRSLIYDRPIAIVGKHTISQEEFDRTLRNDIARIQAATKSQLTIQDLNQFGFVEKVLERLIAQHLLQQEVERLGITTSETAIRNNARTMDPFLHEGQFDPTQFQTVLKRAGLTERALVQDIRKQLTQQQYFSTFAGASVLPPFYRDMLLTAMLQKRAFSIAVIDPKNVAVDDSTITLDDLKQFYEEQKDTYKEQEKRDIAVIYLDLKKLAQAHAITAEEIKEFYEKRKETYITPEEREIYKIFAPTETKLEEVRKEIDTAKSVDKLREKVKDIRIEHLGLLKKNNFPESDADFILDTEAGKYSQAHQEGLGFVIYFVKKILPQKQKDLSEVQQEIREEISLERFQDDYKNMLNKIEDEIAAGANLDDIIASYKLEKFKFNKFSMETSLKDEKKLDDIEKDIKQQAFDLTEGSSGNILEATPYKSFMVVVDKVYPEHVLEFEEVKARVKKEIINEKKEKKAEELAKKIVSAVKNPESLAKLCKEHHLTLETNKVYSRKTAAEDDSLQKKGLLNPIDRAFSMPLNKATFSATKDGFVIVMPEKDIQSTFDEKEKADMLKRFEQLMYESMATFLTDDLKKYYNVSIKKANLDAYLKLITKE